MNLLYVILWAAILATVSAGYNPVTLTQNGVYIGPSATHAAASAHSTRGK